MRDIVDEFAYYVGRVMCEMFGRHNRSCRGRIDHIRYDGTGLIL